LRVFEPEAESFAKVWESFGEFRTVASVAVGDLTDHFHLESVALLHQRYSTDAGTYNTHTLYVRTISMGTGNQ
jgi:hypothetical protein